MKTILGTLLFILFTNLGFAQEVLPDSTFSDRKEAKNLMVNGVKQGKWIEYYDNANHPLTSAKDAIYILLIVYKDGLPYGIVRKYDGSQLFATIPYKNGKRNGIMKKYYFYNKGVKSEIPYINDSICGIVRDYYETPYNLKCETPYVGDQMNGIQKAYRTDGKTISSEITFAGNKRNGLTKEYYPDGKIQYETFYQDDKKNGVKKMYREDGGVAWEVTYINGRLDDASIKTPKDNMPDSIKKVVGQVTGFVKVVHPWCTDICTDKTAEYIKPRKFPNKKMYVKRGDSNYFSNPIVMEFTSDTDGSFHITLPPGAYIIIGENKLNKPNYDSLLSKYANGSKYCVPIKASDTSCINRWYRTPEASFIIGNNCLKGINIVYYLPCFGDCELPCLQPRMHRI